VDPVADLIWDAGGTLFDTYPAVVAACQAALREFGYDASETWLMGLFRKTTTHALQTVAETFDIEQEALTATYRTAYAALGPEVQPPFPYVREVCALICARGGRNFIVTHRARASLESLLDAHRLTSYFTDWITKEDPYPRKPDPTSLLVMLARHGLEPERCMAVGDRELDVWAGKRAGLRTCFFSLDGDMPQADLTVTGFDQLLSWLRGHVPPNRMNKTGGSA
jgi:phosphoglycolate phosphatase-like HAD superfamily hydrolase